MHARPVRVVVDLDQCECNAICVGIAPDIFAIDDSDQTVHVIDVRPKAGMWTAVEEAVRRCPVQAISLDSG